MNSISDSIRQVVSQYFDVDPDMLLKLMQDYLKETADDWNYVLPGQLHKLMEAGETSEYFIVDVRKPEDFNKGHIPSAVNIFWLDILNNLEKLPVDKTILIVCYVGHTASQLLPILSVLGYKTKALKYGMGMPPDDGQVKGWYNYSFPVES